MARHIKKKSTSRRPMVREAPGIYVPATSEEPPRAISARHELGQFPTPRPVAELMASMFANREKDVRLLDAGAGAGALIRAFVTARRAARPRPKTIQAVAYEVDVSLLPLLQETLDDCGRICAAAGIEFAGEIRNADFIEAALPLVRRELFSRPEAPFNAAILNPPYRKIDSHSRTRLLLRAAGIETGNLYAGFLALAAQLLGEGGEMVAITPRSFANGPYFRPFRNLFLKLMSLRRLHVFDSRSAAFRRDNVLQENIILHAVKSRVKPNTVTVSRSSGAPDAPVTDRPCAYEELVSPADPEQFVHIVCDDVQQSARHLLAQLHTGLAELGLDVSTGRVVDFRARVFLAAEPMDGMVPLIYPCHFHGGFVHWPKRPSRKPNAILDAEFTRHMLVPAAVYVLVKRFTSKEERRRVVACVYDPSRVPAARVGFENHLNYFHARGEGLSLALARGLWAFLNSTVLDVYFRQFNGHTQVNATDLRNMRYPTREELESLGCHLALDSPTQSQIDELVKRELFHEQCSKAETRGPPKEESRRGQGCSQPARIRSATMQ